MDTDLQTHWDRIYATKGVRHVSWYRPHLDTSLALIDETHVPRNAPLIDVGAGASTLIDDLCRLGYSNLTALDISTEAISIVRERLGANANQVNFVVGNILDVDLPRHRYLLWHDRAVFHFLTDLDDRKKYLERLKQAVAPGAFVIIATFGTQGPERCSGLPTMRYAAGDVTDLLGDGFRLIVEREERHVTPASVKQQFMYGLWRRDAAKIVTVP